MPDSLSSTETIAIRNCRALLPGGFADGVTIVIHEGRIAEIGGGALGADRAIAADGMTVLPGLVDLHGDAFERELAPRPGIAVPIDLALSANDAALIASGITTFFFAITDGFEPGVRGRETVRRLLAEIEARRNDLRCDNRVHIRHELAATEDHQELLDWIAGGRIDLLSLNDHLPPVDDPRKMERYRAGLKRRVAMTDAEGDAFVAGLQDRRPEGERQTDTLAAACHEAGVALASHDEMTAEDAARAESLGTSVCEFPMTVTCAEAALARDAFVVMGAPNLVRGGSHVGGTSVRDEVAAGRVTALVSDYHYPSLTRAPFLLDELGILPLADAWRLVSENPARAAGLGDRKGAIKVGLDADLIAFGGGTGTPSGLPTEIDLVVVGGAVASAR